MSKKTSYLFLILSILFIPSIASAEIINSVFVSDPVYIGQTAHMPAILWFIILGLAFLFFVLSLKIKSEYCPDLLSELSIFLFALLAVTSFFVESWTYESGLVQLNETAQIVIQPVIYQMPGWMAMIMILMMALGIVNLYRIYIEKLTRASDIKMSTGGKLI